MIGQLVRLTAGASLAAAAVALAAPAGVVPPPLTPPASDPAAMLLQAAERTAAIPSARVAFEGFVRTGLRLPGGGEVSASAGTVASGEYEAPDRVHVVGDGYEAIAVGARVWQRTATGWRVVPTVPVPGIAVIRPTELAALVRRAEGVVEDLGPSLEGGVRVRHLRFSVPPPAPGVSGTAEVWIDGDEGLIRRTSLTARGSTDAAVLGVGGGRASIDARATIQLMDVGLPVHVEPPAGDEGPVTRAWDEAGPRNAQPPLRASGPDSADASAQASGPDSAHASGRASGGFRSSPPRAPAPALESPRLFGLRVPWLELFGAASPSSPPAAEGGAQAGASASWESQARRPSAGLGWSWLLRTALGSAGSDGCGRVPAGGWGPAVGMLGWS